MPTVNFAFQIESCTFLFFSMQQPIVAIQSSSNHLTRCHPFKFSIWTHNGTFDREKRISCAFIESHVGFWFDYVQNWCQQIVWIWIFDRGAHDHESKADRKPNKPWMRDAQLLPWVQRALTEQAPSGWSECMRTFFFVHDEMHFASHDTRAIRQMREMQTIRHSSASNHYSTDVVGFLSLKFQQFLISRAQLPPFICLPCKLPFVYGIIK